MGAELDSKEFDAAFPPANPREKIQELQDELQELAKEVDAAKALGLSETEIYSKALRIKTHQQELLKQAENQEAER